MERLRERHNDDVELQGDPGDSNGDNLETTRERADQLLRAGQDAIMRALSGDSTQYLNSMRQEGGQ